jgi:hypothetical protein
MLHDQTEKAKIRRNYILAKPRYGRGRFRHVSRLSIALFAFDVMLNLALQASGLLNRPGAALLAWTLTAGLLLWVVFELGVSWGRPPQRLGLNASADDPVERLKELQRAGDTLRVRILNSTDAESVVVLKATCDAWLDAAFDIPNLRQSQIEALRMGGLYKIADGDGMKSVETKSDKRFLLTQVAARLKQIERLTS